MSTPTRAIPRTDASARDTGAGPAPVSPAHDAGLLLLRLALGLTMAVHGAQKLFGWFGGGGIEGTGRFFASLGYPSGEAMAVVAGLTETAGGLALVLGLLTPLAGAAVLGTMINAVAVKWGGGFFAPRGVEYELLLTAAAAALTLTGPGRWAVDRLLPVLRPHRLAHGAAAVALGAAAAGLTLLARS
ncbi:MAG TPA: DoxX family protein [Streptomyces sp.]|uniref:DoxX family protein n=1 Tax=Streptomyces sp. TaxID=1931 RepID=UPI002D23E906|nr:DoxX family protein [Streptomyces sp.]HZG04874.1 DoxX family protein [Streptomyces sp.]